MTWAETLGACNRMWSWRSCFGTRAANRIEGGQAAHLSRAIAITACLVAAALGVDATPAPWQPIEMPAGARPFATPSQVARALAGPYSVVVGPLEVNGDRVRSDAALLYPKVAPAIVVIQTPIALGTGFVVDKAGWIITNRHVIESSSTDPATGAQQAVVYFGNLDKEGSMQLDEHGLPAQVYATSAQKDLALLKLTRLPKGRNTVPALKLAKSVAPPGSGCVAIGHPVAGMLWTVRTGRVSAIGKWPSDMVDLTMARLSANRRDREQLSKLIGSLPKRKIVLSSCGINPGDSGGPLVNDQGEVIAVTFAIPRNDKQSGISLDKFAYHVHLDELKAFLGKRPSRPPVSVPSPWPMGVYSCLRDLNGNQKPDVILFAPELLGPVSGYLMDLDESSPRLQPADLANPAQRDKWDFEFAIQELPVLRTFYDTDNDGNIDLVLTSSTGSPVADAVLRLARGKWRPTKPVNQQIFDPKLFDDQRLGKNLVNLRRMMGK